MSGLHKCEESRNPRHAGRCDCGEPLKQPRRVEFERGPRRDLQYEAMFLPEIAKRAERRFGIGSIGWAEAVAHRLELGQERYGDAWVNLNLPIEGTEEGYDGGAYAVLDMQKLISDPGQVDTAGVSFHLVSAAEHAVAMTFHFQQARR